MLQHQNRMEQQSWYSELATKADEININIGPNNIKKHKKSQWKKVVKTHIEKQINCILQQQAKEKTKLRFLKDDQFGKKQYLQEVNAEQCRIIMEIRLNMIDLKMNFKGMYEDTTCVGCFQTEETTEHFFECPKYNEITGVQVKGNEPFKSTEWLTQAAEHYKLLQQIRHYRLAYDARHCEEILHAED